MPNGRNYLQRYYVLAVRWEEDSDWSVEFGAWDRNDVVYESEESLSATAHQIRVVAVSGGNSQKCIDEAMNNLRSTHGYRRK